MVLAMVRANDSLLSIVVGIRKFVFASDAHTYRHRMFAVAYRYAKTHASRTECDGLKERHMHNEQFSENTIKM